MYENYPESARIAALALDEAMRVRNNLPFHTNFCGSCRMVHDQRDSCTIPDAPYYVCSNDTFMSGWGLASNQINVCVVPVASMKEAQNVIEYIKTRSDQKYARICTTKPRARGRKLSLLLAWRYKALDIKEPRGEPVTRVISTLD